MNGAYAAVNDEIKNTFAGQVRSSDQIRFMFNSSENRVFHLKTLHSDQQMGLCCLTAMTARMFMAIRRLKHVFGSFPNHQRPPSSASVLARIGF